MSKNTINDLREELFDTIKLLKTKQMDLETAQMIAATAREICNVTKLELEFLKITGGLGTGFIPDAEDEYFTRVTEGLPPEMSKEKRNTVDIQLATGISKRKDVRFSVIEKEIIEFLMENGGQNRIGIIAQTRYETIRHLEVLEKKGILICVEPPKKLEFSSTRISEEIANYCGVWKLSQ